jgi:hypothetical protein
MMAHPFDNACISLRRGVLGCGGTDDRTGAIVSLSGSNRDPSLENNYERIEDKYRRIYE